MVPFPCVLTLLSFILISKLWDKKISKKRFGLSLALITEGNKNYFLLLLTTGLENNNKHDVIEGSKINQDKLRW